MQYWLDTPGTIPEGVGFSHFDSCHMCWLAGFLIFSAAICRFYRRLSPRKRLLLRRLFAGLILCAEVCKAVVLSILGQYGPAYFPLHLCSINIFVIALHALRPGKLLDNFLYVVCLPGAAFALVFPEWNALPAGNLFHIFSFVTHILLAAYPLMLLWGADLKPDIRYLPGCLALLCVLALAALAANLLWGTNFMFLMGASKGNPLYWFQQRFGSHLIGFAVIISGVIALMYAPILLRQLESRRRH